MRIIALLILLALVVSLAWGSDFAMRYPTKTPLEVMGVVTAPTASNSACSVGQVAYDSNYIYVCTAANTWSRGAIATWAIVRDAMMIDGDQMQIDGEDMQL